MILNAYAAPGVNFTLGNPRLDLINSIVSAYFDVSDMSILNTSRKRELVLVRQFNHYFMQRYSGMKLIDIASHLPLDHSTLIHSRHSINDLCEFDSAMAETRYNIDELIIKALNDDDLQDNQRTQQGRAVECPAAG